MKRLTELKSQHTSLTFDLLVAFRKHEFLVVQGWADPVGIADVVAADLMIVTSGLLDDCYFEEPAMKVLEPNDIFAVRYEDDKFVVLSLMGTTAKILDLLDFEEKMITVQRDREYVVWGTIREED